MTMRFTSQIRWAPALGRIAALLLLLATVSGCDRQQVTTRRVPKDSAAPSDQSDGSASSLAGPADFHAGMSTVRARPAWTLPEGWQEIPPASQMRVANFIAVSKTGQTNDISVIPMASGASEADLVLMWRQQLQLPMDGPGGGQDSAPVAIGADQGKLFDLVSEQPIVDGKSRARMLVAMLPRGGTTWFFKMTGEDAFVREQKPAFLQFLKSISFGGETASAGSFQLLSPENSAATARNSANEIPPDWKEAPPTQFVTAKYVVAGAGDTKAEVSVSTLGGDGGGLLANVNRWRGQLSLPPISEADLTKQSSSLDAATGKATVVDLSGTDKTGRKARLIGAVAPQAGQTCFFKLMGDPEVVEAQKAAFAKFVQTAKY